MDLPKDIQKLLTKAEVQSHDGLICDVLMLHDRAKDLAFKQDIALPASNALGVQMYAGQQQLTFFQVFHRSYSPSKNSLFGLEQAMAYFPLDFSAKLFCDFEKKYFSQSYTLDPSCFKSLYQN